MVKANGLGDAQAAVLHRAQEQAVTTRVGIRNQSREVIFKPDDFDRLGFCPAKSESALLSQV